MLVVISAALLLAGALAHAAGGDFYWKNSYGRGVGVVQVQYCTDSSRSIEAGLCYKTPNAGYNCNGTNTCVSGCPSGFSSSGMLTCQKDGPLTYVVDNYTLVGSIPSVSGGACRTTGGNCSTQKVNCKRALGTEWCELKTVCEPVVTHCDPIVQNCSSGKSLQDGLCYDSCRSGYSKQALTCVQACRDGYSLAGLSCNQNQPTTVAKQTYDRGVGTIPALRCANGLENDASLCYTPCRPGYNGIGPVCWGNAPPGYVSCGAGVARSKEICASVTAGQASSAVIFLGTGACAVIDAFFGNGCSQATNAAKALVWTSKAKELNPSTLSKLGSAAITYLPKAFTVVANMSKIYEDWIKASIQGNPSASVTQSIIALTRSADFQSAQAAGNEIYRAMGMTLQSPVAGMTDAEIALLSVRSFTEVVGMSMAIAGIVNPAIVNTAFTTASNSLSVISAYAFTSYGE